ncbi:MAG: estB 4 [Thermoleophilia bacterium]|nr:estB 4 [Thermoleophilia bacterium]
MRAFDRAYVNLIRTVERMFPGPERLGVPATEAMQAAAKASDPVVLVHGMGNTVKTWTEMARTLRKDGFDVHIVALPDNAMGSTLEGAKVLDAAIDDVRLKTGRTNVQLLAFSLGGVVSRVHLELNDGWRGVSRLVTIATPHHGSLIAPTADRLARVPFLRKLPQATLDLAPDSAVFQKLNAAYDPADGGKYHSIYAPAFDGFVLPYDSAKLEGASNVVLSGDRQWGKFSAHPNHYSIVHQSDEAYEAARSALLGAEPVTAPDVTKVAKVAAGIHDDLAPA